MLSPKLKMQRDKHQLKENWKCFLIIPIYQDLQVTTGSLKFRLVDCQNYDLLYYDVGNGCHLTTTIVNESSNSFII